MLNFLPKINRYCTTFETLAEIERDCNERQLYMGDFGRSLRRRLLQLLQSPTQFPPLISRIDILQRTTTLHGRLVSIVYCFIHTVYVQRYCSQPLKMQIFERLLHVLFNSCVFGQCSYTIPGHESLRYQINPSL